MMLPATAEELIWDTVDFYSYDPYERRSVLQGGTTCVYVPDHNGTTGCAIGRLLDPSEREEAEQWDIDSRSVTSIYSELHIEHREVFTMGILAGLQSLHDGEDMWNEDDGGLSESGMELLQALLYEANGEQGLTEYGNILIDAARVVL